MQAMQTCGASKQRHLASPRLTVVKFFTRRPLGRALLISRRFVIRSAYSSRLSASIILLAFCLRADDYSPRGWRNIDTASASALRESCRSILLNDNIYNSPWHIQPVRVSKVKPASLRYFQRTEPWDGLPAEHALRQSRDADHRLFTVGLPASRSSASRL